MVYGVVEAASVACKAHKKISTAKSLFNAIDTIETVCVAEGVGVDSALSTNISSGTVTDVEKCCFTSLIAIGGTSGVVAKFTVSCTAR